MGRGICSVLVFVVVGVGLAATVDFGNGGLFKVALTQQGYIQFLKYDVHVPALRDFTSCIWIKSSNMSNEQSILSYSQHEDRRLIRLWISPYGLKIHLELFGVPVMNADLGVVVGEWYHLCQTWSSADGLWGFYKNNKLIATGTSWSHKLLRRPISPHGDIVIGQEYTDFDKGLEDGIEGEIFGFNLLVNSQSSVHHRPPSPWAPRRRRRGASRRLKESRSAKEFINSCYNSCREGRGTPATVTKHLLIAWGKTPMGVFGGAVIKNALAVCSVF